MADKIYIGRRKSSVARVILRNGTGKVTINKRDIEVYFPLKDYREDVLLPLKLTENLGKYDVIANAKGGGIRGQSEAGNGSRKPTRDGSHPNSTQSRASW